MRNRTTAEIMTVRTLIRALLTLDQNIPVISSQGYLITDPKIITLPLHKEKGLNLMGYTVDTATRSGYEPTHMVEILQLGNTCMPCVHPDIYKTAKKVTDESQRVN
jgi:hypothetical protein